MARINFNKLTLANSDDQFLAAIDSIKRRGELVRLDIHLFLVAVASRWASTGDVRPAVKMVNLLTEALPSGIRSNAIKAWIEVQLGFKYEDNVFTAGDRKHTDLSIKTLANVRWWEFKPEPEYKGMDFTAAVLMLVKKADERQRKADPRDTIQPDILRAVKFAAGGKALGATQIIDAIHALDSAALAEVLHALTPVEQAIAA